MKWGKHTHAAVGDDQLILPINVSIWRELCLHRPRSWQCHVHTSGWTYICFKAGQTSRFWHHGYFVVGSIFFYNPAFLVINASGAPKILSRRRQHILSKLPFCRFTAFRQADIKRRKLFISKSGQNWVYICFGSPCGFLHREFFWNSSHPLGLETVWNECTRTIDLLVTIPPLLFAAGYWRSYSKPIAGHRLPCNSWPRFLGGGFEAKPPAMRQWVVALVIA